MTVLNSVERMSAYQQALEQTYRYYQFTGNMACAVLVLFALRNFVAETWSPSAFDPTSWILLLVVVILLWASYESFVSTVGTLKQVLSGIAAAPKEERTESGSIQDGASSGD